MQLEPADLGEGDWKILKEKIWNSRVLIDPSADRQHTPYSTMAARHFATAANSYEGLWTHIIPLPSQADAEALTISFLHRIQPNTHSVATVVSERFLDGFELRGACSVRALEIDTVGKGMTGRGCHIVAVVNNVAFGVGYGSLGECWSHDRFVSVAQLQADKIRGQVAAV